MRIYKFVPTFFGGGEFRYMAGMRSLFSSEKSLFTIKRSHFTIEKCLFTIEKCLLFSKR